jgi:hypothetical protein
MPQSLTRWPVWYLVLIGYTAVLALSALRTRSAADSALRRQVTATTDPHGRGLVMGERVAGWVRASGWLVAVVLLLLGSVWALTLVATGYVLSARRYYHDFARGFAEGRKSAELAAAHDYVQGRVPPRSVDYLAAGVVVAVARILPLAATLVAMNWLPR